MKHFELIERALRLVWRYKALWVFGILLALTGGSAGGGTGWQFGGPNGREWNPPAPFAPPMSGDFPAWPQFAAIAGTALLCCCCLILILTVVSIVVRVVAKAALYRMVDQTEETGQMPTVKEGFRLGWTNRTFRLWLMELLIGIAVFLLGLVLFVPALSPLLLLLTENDTLRVLGGILAGLLILLVILIMVAVGAAVSGMREFWGREIVLADRGIGDAFATGFELVRRNFTDVFVMWLLLLGIGLLFGLLMIPVTFIVLMLAGAVGVGLGWLMHLITNSMWWAVAFGLPPFILLVFIPLAIIGGLYAAFHSAAWTLTYREVAGREAIADSGE